MLTGKNDPPKSSCQSDVEISFFVVVLLFAVALTRPQQVLALMVY